MDSKVARKSFVPSRTADSIERIELLAGQLLPVLTAATESVLVHDNRNEQFISSRQPLLSLSQDPPNHDLLRTTDQNNATAENNRVSIHQ